MGIPFFVFLFLLKVIDLSVSNKKHKGRPFLKVGMNYLKLKEKSENMQHCK